MHAAFPIVMFGAIALFVVLGVLSMLTRNNLYDQIGQGGLSFGEDQAGGVRRESSGLGEPELTAGQSSIGRDEREQEIRQMLQARSDRLVNQGHDPLDIDAELARLEPPVGGHLDSGLTLEVRQLVVARNERRRRQGQPALDVEAEVERTLAELDP